MSKRNLKLDLLRGFFITIMLVDHVTFYVGKNIFYYLNGSGNLWVSPAEGFVFISGYMVGFIYYPKHVHDGAVKVFNTYGSAPFCFTR